MAAYWVKFAFRVTMRKSLTRVRVVRVGVCVQGCRGELNATHGRDWLDDVRVLRWFDLAGRSPREALMAVRGGAWRA